MFNKVLITLFMFFLFSSPVHAESTKKTMSSEYIESVWCDEFIHKLKEDRYISGSDVYGLTYVRFTSSGREIRDMLVNGEKLTPLPRDWDVIYINSNSKEEDGKILALNNHNKTAWLYGITE